MPKMRRDSYMTLWWADCIKCRSAVTGPYGSDLSEEETAAAAREAGWRDTGDGWICSQHATA